MSRVRSYEWRQSGAHVVSDCEETLKTRVFCRVETLLIVQIRNTFAWGYVTHKLARYRDAVLSRQIIWEASSGILQFCTSRFFNFCKLYPLPNDQLVFDAATDD